MADDKKLVTGYHPGPFDKDDTDTGGKNNRGRQPQRSASQRGRSADDARTAESESNANDATAPKRSLSLGAAPRGERSPLVTAATGQEEKLASQKANGIDREPGADASLDNLVDGMSRLNLGDGPRTAAAVKTPTVENALTPAVEKAPERDSFDDKFGWDTDDEAFDEFAKALDAEADEKHLIAGEMRDGQTPYLTRQQFHTAHAHWPTGQETAARFHLQDG